MTTTLATRELRGGEIGPWLPQLAQWSLGDDATAADLVATYPQVFDPRGGARSFACFDGDELVSHVAMRVVSIVGAAGVFRAALVGSVATAPHARGNGHASRLLVEVESAASAAGAAAVLLWSDRWDFYARLGYEPAGRQLEFGLRASAAGDVDVRRMRQDDLPSLLALHEAKPLRVVRDDAETALLFGGGSTTFVLERERAVRAYACLGKGVDFAGWWHEVGGADADLAALLPAATHAVGRDHAHVAVAPSRLPLVRALRARLLDFGEGVCALRKSLPGPDAGCAAADFFVDGLDSI